MKLAADSNQLRTREILIESIADLLHGLSNMFEVQSHEIEKFTGLSKRQALTLNVLSRAPMINVSKLAKSMHLKMSNMVSILDKLEEQGLINRTRSKEDRRVVEIELTEKAKVTEKVMQKIIRNSLIHLFESSDEHDLIEIHKVLQKTASHIDVTFMNTYLLRESDSLEGQ